jgi:hypothetical protein
MESELTAYHEAGHVIVALQLGARVRLVTIEPNHDDGPLRYGNTEVLWSKSRYSEKQLQENFVKTALAGPVTEMIYTGEPLHPAFVKEWVDDWRHAWEAAASLHTQPERRLTWLEASIRKLHAELKDSFWPAIAALADELAAHETLEEDMILSAVEPWLKLDR